MAGILTLKCSLIKGGMAKFGQNAPIFKPSPIDPLYSDRLIFQGISVDLRGSGEQFSMDATVAYKQAALNCIEYLTKVVGYTKEQAYLLLSAAPVDSHVAGIVDSPNACVTMSLPVGIFDFDINPSQNGPSEIAPTTSLKHSLRLTIYPCCSLTGSWAVCHHKPLT